MNDNIAENPRDPQWWKHEQIRYWRETTDHYLKFGTTIQAGIFRDDGSAGESYDDNNRTIVRRSGLRAGQTVLDAGCGVGGPALYAALRVPDLEVHGITLSPYQAELAQKLIADSPAAGRVHVQAADYHKLPFPDRKFDSALFLESAGYSFELEKLFAEVARVLRDEGRVYIKDVFCRAGELTVQEWKQIDLFRRIYVQPTPPMEEMAAALAATGFTVTSMLDITPMVAPKPREKDFGLPRFRTFPVLPIHWGEIVAVKTAG
ncbi:MAG: class I SAM-dependent methyltransferase [Gammaproteobacteria bacterium]|nr:class I SAM-dependent methyltransferase [Gammaproteobacteria bacterium]MYA67118.1 class I SAM-dependent methyltransferase [Gammaproteobacteria bacterium]MYG96430.1 class I SAM-dependent methyltransferase [Gammaproteobacteria bacterium]MYH46778.1 class I SAM-dependent methyltransferase [Gammaproteobacteria bacterium]MYL12163.1 class I SAM-dependent methyltransferase [Gammaproteobacteria bacterium]